MSFNPFLPQNSSVKQSELKFKSKASKMNQLKVAEQQYNARFKSKLSDNDDNNDYDFSPHIQQYNFNDISPKQREQLLKSAIQQAKKSVNSGNSQSSIVKRQSQIVQNLKNRISSLLQENAKLRYQNQELKLQLVDIHKKLEQKSEQLKIMNKNGIQKLSQSQSRKLISKSKRSPQNIRNSYKSKQNSLYTSPQKYTTRLSNFGGGSSPLLKELLLECTQSNEFQQVSKKSKQTKVSSQQGKDQFYQFKDTKDCCQPFYSILSKQNQLRMKKSMIRQKQLVYKDDFIEIGCITKKLGDYEFSINVVLTNIFSQSIKNINVAYLCKGDISLEKQLKSKVLQVQKSTKFHTIYQSLSSAEQLRQKATVLVHNIDFRCILLNVQFQDYKGQKHQISLILPGCKHKLFNFLVNTPVRQDMIIVEKVTHIDKKILPELQKLKSYYKNIQFTKDRNGNVEAYLKIQFLRKIFFICFKNVGNDDKVSICVYHHRQDSILAEKILSQLIFLYGR